MSDGLVLAKCDIRHDEGIAVYTDDVLTEADLTIGVAENRFAFPGVILDVERICWTY